MRRTLERAAPLHFQKKWPNFVSFHKFPWQMVRPGDASFFDCTAEHYEQLLTLSSKVTLPAVFLKNHPAIPEAKWASLLPGTFYILPQTTPLTASTAKTEDDVAVNDLEWAPFGWSGSRVSTQNIHALGGLAARVGDVVAVHSFSSPDLRLFCNAITIGEISLTSRAGSSLSSLQKSNKQFTLFHFHRPNRSPAEIVKPLERFYVHHPDLSVLEGCATKDWTPVLERTHPQRQGKVAPMIFRPPSWYVPGLLPDKAGLIPGGCFGHRDLQWGHRW